VLAHEAGGTDTADPLGGAYFLESLTRELEERASALIERIDELGGAVAAVEQGFTQHEIEDAAYEYERKLESGENVVVGVNRFAEEDPGGDEIELHLLDPEAEQRQAERTARVRAERDAAATEAALARVREAAVGTENLLPPMREALAAHSTVGEICNALRDEFGTYDAHNAP
jgi:methylmalonyl-CoA mutase N-terminal domain/subunit